MFKFPPYPKTGNEGDEKKDPTVNAAFPGIHPIKLILHSPILYNPQNHNLILLRQ